MELILGDDIFCINDFQTKVIGILMKLMPLEPCQNYLPISGMRRSSGTQTGRFVS